jgi:DNA-binding NtrC family response regulator
VEDIDFLSDIFLTNFNQKHGKNIQSVHPQVIRAFKSYNWPGNIRELENLMERAYILESSSSLTPENFPAELFDSTTEEVSAIMPVDAQLPLSEARRRAIDDFERQYLKELFARNKGKVSRTAEEAGVSTRQLNKLMVKYGIRKEAFKE